MAASMSSRIARRASSRMRDSIQKNEAIRLPRVTGSARRELDLMRAGAVLDHQLAAVVIGRFAEEQGRREVGADRARAVGQEADGVVDVIAKGMAVASVVAVEQRREDRLRQGGRHEETIDFERAEDDRSRLLTAFAIGGDLAIAFGERGLATGGTLAVLPAPAVDQAPDFGDLLGGEELGDGEKHGPGF